ncbi:hypothetical protein MmiAt1_16680 [Methanimicrococcus sp. At1]|uniref:Schlafen AlbA-2 domain-containing protein n=1 Tax=Methanimicrococcus hacksteinii TaxID=3028293 RepID=A0ABU3VRL4_9EURY|nr:RNA-binding domain-containing protein [Methanimicrococcus sp. At1]MDV0446058.1 hypothetical protein [Methanimicrococcus sp. At1]
MVFSEGELIEILTVLRTHPSENEVFEFKEAKNNYDFRKLCKYFSALSNEANLKHQEYAWLIFGIKDSDHSIVGSVYRSDCSALDSLKQEIANRMNNRLTFIEIYELSVENKRVILFQIPSAICGIPTSYEGHYYGRDGESLGALNPSEYERIRNEISQDWSACLVPSATLGDLDPLAIEQARQNYKTKFPDKTGEVDEWDDITFLNKAKITVQGKITNTALLLLGKEESEHFLSPADAKIRWILKSSNNFEKDYTIFSIPFLLAIDKVHNKIRNITYRYLRDNTLFPEEVLQYEPFVIREALNNCIAHQDYLKGSRINVVEIEDEALVFTNKGYFIPGSVEKVISMDAPEEHYRNRFLANAMFNLKMVDTAGGGIKKMFNLQRQRFFPMPEYDLNNETVKVIIVGKVLDFQFATALIHNPDLSLEDIVMLDKVQKKKVLSDAEISHLKRLKLIEGRKPNFVISLNALLKTKDSGLKASTLRKKGLDDDHYKGLIVKYLNDYGSASRKDIDELLLPKLGTKYEGASKTNKVGNLLGALRDSGIIQNAGTKNKPKYVLVSDSK